MRDVLAKSIFSSQSLSGRVVKASALEAVLNHLTFLLQEKLRLSSRLEFQLTTLEDPGNLFTKIHHAVYFILHINQFSSLIIIKWLTDGTEFEIFTDGSKTGKGTASTFCVFRHGFIHHKWWAKLDDTNSVFQAEVVALKEAMLWLS
ncbi:hypothetical protein AVEN_133096-1 [Araneus ventricosus]|uniref:RNase H type-1 domain-containing protein n=1 Tax=Araneus ventricosus TaxID=182803 RepID=A0A4Y2FXT3_ARAVE|nr:hypothetical protein AVEN_133096-1 [Araneus ventricosus]